MTPRRLVDVEPSIFDETGDLFPGASPSSAIAISTLTITAKEILEGAFIPMWVRGEISDFKAHRNGHWYFSMRDDTSQMRCVVWSRDARRIPAPPDDGMQVVVYGRLTVYEARGEMQFAVTRMQAEGDGLWRKALEVTRRRLEAAGLLAPERKRALPRFPRTIAVVTSPDGAALRDIVAVVRRRGAATRIVVAAAAVQGETAPAELRRALALVRRWGKADLVIIARGGGSREDLWAFNDERVARALAASPVPTISAVGHEIDMSICDLVADVRAATPSVAAEIATRSREELVTRVTGLRNQLRRGVERVIDRASERLREDGHGLGLAAHQLARRRRARIESLAGRLDALSPLATLARGYSVARTTDGRGLSSAIDFLPGMPYELVVRDGTVQSTAVRATLTTEKELG